MASNILTPGRALAANSNLIQAGLALLPVPLRDRPGIWHRPAYGSAGGVGHRQSKAPRAKPALSAFAKRTSRRMLSLSVVNYEQLTQKRAGELPAWIYEPARLPCRHSMIPASEDLPRLNPTSKLPAASSTVCGHSGRFAGPVLGRCSVSGGCGSAPRSPT